ncbi:MAG: radical SAM protein [Acidilobaceae archaeon]
MGSGSWRVLRPFDPWRSPLCTCPPKWTVNPYTGCGHGCLYCYASSYIRRFFEPRLKPGLVESVERDSRRVPRGSLVELSASSDPLQPLELEHRATARVLGLLLSRGFRVLVTTKAPHVLLDYAEVLEKHKGRVAVAVTVTTLDERLAAILEPGAPPPQLRLRAVARLASAGIPVTIRLDPIIPLVNDSSENIEAVVREAARAGALQITASTYKAKPDNFERLARALPSIEGELRRLYRLEGERVRGYRYLKRSLRQEILEKAREATEKHALEFATCREGILVTKTVCDGSGYIRSP